eukprot:Gb_15810 [translate_table: standard]
MSSCSREAPWLEFGSPANVVINHYGAQVQERHPAWVPGKILGSMDVKDEMQQFPGGLQLLQDAIRVIASDVHELKQDMEILKAHHRMREEYKKEKSAWRKHRREDLGHRNRGCKDKKKHLRKELRGIGACMKYTTRDEVEVQPGCDVLRGDEGHVDHGEDEDLPLIPTTIVSQPLEGATMTSHRRISNQYDEMGGGFPPDDEGNGAFINVDCRIMPCPTHKNHHDMMLPVNDEHVELPAIGVDVLNGAQSPLTHNHINEITPSLIEKATAQNSYGLGQDLNGSERLSTEMGVPPMSSHMEEIMPMLDGVNPETLCSVGREEIMEETSRHNNIYHENHEQHTNTVQRNHIVDGLAQFDRGAMPEVAMPRGNVDWQPVTSTVVVLRYIAKYAAKAERRSESYHDMLMMVANIENPNDAAAQAYKRFLSETLVDHDIGA